MSEAGRKRRRRAQGPKAERLRAALSELDPQLAEWADGFIFDEVWGRPGLSQEERMLVASAALAMRGDQDRLRAYLFGALHDGVPARKLHETLLMLCVYGGFPTAIAALTTLRQVREAAARQGVDSSLGDGS
jgi:4-carboxymuconolactone decarboxylase